MKTRFSFIDPSAIMGVIIALVVLGVGTFAYFITAQNLLGAFPSGAADGAVNASRAQYWMTANNSTTTSGQIFNIIGIVLIIGAIMSIIGLCYNYVR